MVFIIPGESIFVVTETAVSGHTEVTRAKEITEAQTRGPGNAQFPRNWRYGLMGHM